MATDKEKLADFKIEAANKLAESKEAGANKLAEAKEASDKKLDEASENWQKKFDEAEKAANKKLAEATEGLDEYQDHLKSEKSKSDKIRKDNLKNFNIDKSKYAFNAEIEVIKFKHTNDSFKGLYQYSVEHDDMLLHCFINHDTMQNAYLESHEQIDAAIVGNVRTRNVLRFVYTEDDKTENERFTTYHL